VFLASTHHHPHTTSAEEGPPRTGITTLLQDRGQEHPTILLCESVTLLHESLPCNRTTTRPQLDPCTCVQAPQDTLRIIHYLRKIWSMGKCRGSRAMDMTCEDP
jgi:hypothetical protein